MNEPTTAVPQTDWPTRILGVLTIATAWVVYFPLGSKYLVYLCSALLAAIVIGRTGRTGRTDCTDDTRRWRSLLRSPLLLAPLALWVLLAASAAWSSAPRSDMLSHLWHYGRMLLVPVIALALPAAAAQGALKHFVCASVMVALATSVQRLHLLSVGELLLSTTADADGHQRIVTSLLLALGMMLGLVQALDAGPRRAARLAWLLAAAVILIGLSLQDRRTGLVALPVLMAVLAIARQRSWWHAAAMLAGVALLTTVVWHTSISVRARFTEGLGEISAYQSTGPVATSWGMRARLVELTLDMIREKPLLGHGIASWVSQWQPRAKGGGTLLEAHTSPHSEVLLIATQAGAAGVALFIAMLATYLAHAWRAGQAGNASLLIWAAIAWSALFTSAIRDAKFALPLLMLAGVGLAAGRET